MYNGVEYSLQFFVRNMLAAAVEIRLKLVQSVMQLLAKHPGTKVLLEDFAFVRVDRYSPGSPAIWARLFAQPQSEPKSAQPNRESPWHRLRPPAQARARTGVPNPTRRDSP